MNLLAEIDSIVDVGRRAPGSDAERRAAAHLEDRLRQLGRDTEVESIEVWPNWPLGYAILAALAVVGSVLSVSVPLAGAALALAAALLTFLDAGVLLPTLRRALGRRASQNLVSWGDRDKPGLLLLVAHLDAGRGGIALSQKAEARRAALGQLIRRPIGALEPLFWAELAVLVCCVLRLANLSGLPLTAIQFVPTVVLIACVALLLDIALADTKAGENDNASGAALALGLAERFGGKLEHFDVHVLFTGAQQAVAGGSRAFLKRHKRELGGERTVVLNLDAVGSGTVRYTEREGPLLAIKSHKQLIRLCEGIAEDDEEEENAFGARPIVNRAPSDGYAARSAGIPAITISCRGRLDYVPARVDEEALGRAEGFCVELIRRLDAEVGPDLAGPVEETVLSEMEET